MHRLLPAILVVTAAAAQDYRAKVQGIVTDSSQAIVPGARVTLRNDNTGIETTRSSDSNGRYFFDFVEPGAYTLTVEQSGFAKFIQQNILVQVRADITVNATLQVGATTETVTVSEVAAPLQFNTSTMDLTVDRKMLTDLPIIARNPFTLAMLDPAVVNRYYSNVPRNPFFMWSSSMIDVGGNTTRRNDLLLDGAPLQLGPKGSYAPPMDAVQEFTVQQNSVDAEFGHSAGGVMSLSMKAGTNDYHGTVSYFGRNPKLNAVSNPITRTENLVKNHIWGGTLGNAIRKNKLFTFTAWEQWRTRDPYSATYTLPTDLERTGDFSQSLNQYGGLRAIHDPWTTQFFPASNTSVRTPFPENRIPASRIDPTSARFMKDIWRPNRPGDNITGVNNYRIGYAWMLSYWNFSNRTDWNINDKWKMFGRYSRFKTTIDQNNYANSPAAINDNGGIMNCRNIAFDTVYTLSATSVINARWSYVSLEDDYDAPRSVVGEKGLEEFWPGNPWYKPYLKDLPAIYYPRIVGGGSFGRQSYWNQHPRNYSYHASIRKTHGRSQWKAGTEGRFSRAYGIHPNLWDFEFGSGLTADTFISADTRRVGHSWATFLLGAIGGDSWARYTPPQDIAVNYYAAYIHNDFKLNQRITLNLGLRYEYEGAPYDKENRLSRYVDISDPIPEIVANPPKIPADVAAIFGKPYRFNGAWIFSDEKNRGWYNTQDVVLIPRAGIAVRVNDRMSMRAGFARYVTPPLTTTNTIDRVDFPGFNAYTSVAPVLEGKPQALLSNPFPSSNPLIMPVGKSLGRYTNLGASASWHRQDFRTTVNDRFNISLQRQLPNQIHADVTWFVNFGHDVPYTKSLNLVDPQLSYTYQAQQSVTVPNPFYMYLTPEKFPGALRNQARVTRASLMRPYPQYTGLSEMNTPGVRNRYHALQVKVQRQFSKGYSYLVAYNYNRERNTTFFNGDDEYIGKFTWLDSSNPRHRLNIAGTYDFPVGRGRAVLSSAHWLVNGMFGGWSTRSILTVSSGEFLRFGQMIVKGDPRIDNPTRDRWFNTDAFERPLPYTPRLNPYQYEGLTGPKPWNFDTTLSKYFPVTEGVKLEFKMEAYNLFNHFVPSNPSTSVLSSLFGRSTGQYAGNRGREMQYTMRILF